jgi:hypothetical protein
MPCTREAGSPSLLQGGSEDTERESSALLGGKFRADGATAGRLSANSVTATTLAGEAIGRHPVQRLGSSTSAVPAAVSSSRWFRHSTFTRA